jgi:hypothetical protein
MIFSTGLAFLFLMQKSTGNTLYRTAASVALVTTFLLIWINGAVGIIGDSNINMFFALVPLVGLVGSAIARLQPKGMSYTLFAMAGVQLLIPIIAFIINTPDFTPGVVQVFLLNGVFVMLFAGAGVGFGRAG